MGPMELPTALPSLSEPASSASPPPALPAPPPSPELAGIVVHWRDEARLAELLAAWPQDDPRFELVVVDNSGTAGAWDGPPAITRERRRDVDGAAPAAAPDPLGPEAPAAAGTPEKRHAATTRTAIGPKPDASPVRLLQPGRNLGFAGGVNAGVAASRAPLLLLLNPDAVPEPGALEHLVEGFAAHPEAAGLAPRLAGPAGEPQFAWQLRRLPSLWDCLRQTLPWPASGDGNGPAAEPPAGTTVEQPAAAALALRREALLAAGGLDERFHPAWFEDVDLAVRLRQAGATLLYWPAARFRHAQGSTVRRLGYGRFLWIYHRNLERYLAKHHGAAWAWAARASLAAGLAVRLPLLAVRRPRRAASRREAAAGLLLAMAGTLSGWRLPRRLAEASSAGADDAPGATAATPPSGTARTAMAPTATATAPNATTTAATPPSATAPAAAAMAPAAAATTTTTAATDHPGGVEHAS